MPTSYTVNRGDSLQSIAQTLYGNASLWYLIADANGLSGGQLTEGMRLSIPNQNTNIHNNASVFKPYNPGQVIGDSTPTMPSPPPPKKSWWQKFTQILLIVVAVVVSIWVPTLLPAMNSMLAAGIGAAAGNCSGLQS